MSVCVSRFLKKKICLVGSTRIVELYFRGGGRGGGGGGRGMGGGEGSGDEYKNTWINRLN
jgi:hypothetical protein